MRGTTFTSVGTFFVETCYRCSIPFGMLVEFKNELVARKDTFYCPRGHAQNYVGESDKQRADRIAAEKLRLEAELEFARKRRADAERQAKSEVTRRRNLQQRVKAGVCPFCQRTFKQLKEHMACKHPGVAKTPCKP